MREKEIVHLIKMLSGFIKMLLRLALGELAPGFKALAVFAQLVSWQFVIDNAIHYPLSQFAFYVWGVGFALGVTIGGVDMVWKFLHLPRV